MGKLLSYELKTHFKQNWFLVAMPILLIIVNIITKTFLSRGYAEIAAALIFIGAIIVYIAAAITVIVNDYNRFYGKEALFYNSLPITPSGITVARLLNYVILYIVHTLLGGINFVAFFLINGYLGEPSFYEELPIVIEGILNQLSRITPRLAIGIIIFCVSFLLYSVGKVMFSISISGEKKINKMDFGGAVLSFIFITVISNSVIIPVINKFATKSLDISLTADGSFTINVTILLIYLVLGILFLVGTYFEHKKRVSVN